MVLLQEFITMLGHPNVKFLNDVLQIVKLHNAATNYQQPKSRTLHRAETHPNVSAIYIFFEKENK